MLWSVEDRYKSSQYMIPLPRHVPNAQVNRGTKLTSCCFELGYTEAGWGGTKHRYKNPLQSLKIF